MYQRTQSHHVKDIIVVGVLGFLCSANPCSAHFTGYNHMHPDRLVLSLCPGDCYTETVQVDLEQPPAQCDIIFCFDTTDSMAGVLATAKAWSVDIMDSVRTLIPDTRFGVMSHRDYDGCCPANCGYTADYGDPGDYPYRLNQELTYDELSVQSAIVALTAAGGGDDPESYVRAFYESYSDPRIDWRYEAKRIVINFADNVPHDCDVYEAVGTAGISTGLDPGRDETLYTSDDLPLLPTLYEMVKNRINLLSITTDADYLDFWC